MKFIGNILENNEGYFLVYYKFPEKLILIIKSGKKGVYTNFLEEFNSPIKSNASGDEFFYELFMLSDNDILQNILIGNL